MAFCTLRVGLMVLGSSLALRFESPKIVGSEVIFRFLHFVTFLKLSCLRKQKVSLD